MGQLQGWQRLADEQLRAAELRAARRAQFYFLTIAGTVLILIAGGLGLLLLWYRRGRDQPVGVAAEYLNAPPARDGQVLTPALAGTLLDERADLRDVLATLVDWAQRGLIRIEARPQGAKTRDPNDDYVYTRVGAPGALTHPYERDLMARLFGDKDERPIGYIREKFTNALKGMFENLYQEVVADGYFQERPDRVRNRFYRYGILLILLVCPAAFLFQIAVSAIGLSDDVFELPGLAPWIALGLVSLALMGLSRFMPRKTRAGAELAARWEAFYL